MLPGIVTVIIIISRPIWKTKLRRYDKSMELELRR